MPTYYTGLSRIPLIDNNAGWYTDQSIAQFICLWKLEIPTQWSTSQDQTETWGFPELPSAVTK